MNGQSKISQRFLHRDIMRYLWRIFHGLQFRSSVGGSRLSKEVLPGSLDV